MSTTYTTMLVTETPEEYEGEHDDNWGDEYRMAVVRLEDGQFAERLGTDGGEPEDNTLNRDWSWVPDALQKAYDLGYRQGYNDHQADVEGYR